MRSNETWVWIALLGAGAALAVTMAMVAQSPNTAGMILRRRRRWKGEEEEEGCHAKKMPPSSEAISQFMATCQDARLAAKLQDVETIVDETFRRFATPGEVAVAYNGGKDCLIVLHVVRAYVERHFSDPSAGMPLVVYFERDDDFDEMVEFMHETGRHMGFSVRILRGGYKSGLAELEAEGIRAIVMGQRRTDPQCPGDAIAPTTAGWPQLMRVNPIIDLDYASVWQIIKGCGFAYCRLYDEGYTSLGSRATTVRNPQLMVTTTSPNGELQSNLACATTNGSGGVISHRPAHELEGGDEIERQGRLH